MKVIIFGGTGWVGHHIAKVFAREKHDVTICSRGRKKEFLAEIEGIKIIHADKTKEEDVEAIFENASYDVVIDSVPSVESMKNILNAGKSIKHYIHCSSTGGYAPLPFLPCTENAPYTGFPYGGFDHKVECDSFALDMFNRQGFPATVIRPCYITGPGNLPLDNLGGRRSGFIPDLMNETEIDVVDNGLALIQPVHIDDLANAFLLAAENRTSIGQVYNICLKTAVTLNKYYEINASVFKKKPNINYMPVEKMLEKYKGEIYEIGLRFLSAHMCFDISKAEKQLGYKPGHTTEEAIEETAYLTGKEYGKQNI